MQMALRPSGGQNGHAPAVGGFSSVPGANGLPAGCPTAPVASSSSLSGNLFPPRRKAKRPELSEDQKLEIKEAFEVFDSEKTGFISFQDLKVCLKAFGFNVKKNDILELCREYDQKQTGRLSYSDFSEIMARKIAERDPIDEIKKAFKLFDDDGTGTISLNNLRRVARELGEQLTDEELQAMIDEFDLNNDGESMIPFAFTCFFASFLGFSAVSEEEFIAIMTQSALL